MMQTPLFVPVAAEAGGTFLGSVLLGPDDKKRWYDLYYVPADTSPEPTLSARHSSYPADYYSGLPFGWAPDDQRAGIQPLVIARMIAESRGLDCHRERYAGKLRRHSNGMLVPTSEPLPEWLAEEAPTKPVITASDLEAFDRAATKAGISLVVGDGQHAASQGPAATPGDEPDHEHPPRHDADFGA